MPSASHRVPCRGTAEHLVSQVTGGRNESHKISRRRTPPRQRKVTPVLLFSCKLLSWCFFGEWTSGLSTNMSKLGQGITKLQWRCTHTSGALFGKNGRLGKSSTFSPELLRRIPTHTARQVGPAGGTKNKTPPPPPPHIQCST